MNLKKKLIKIFLPPKFKKIAPKKCTIIKKNLKNKNENFYKKWSKIRKAQNFKKNRMKLNENEVKNSEKQQKLIKNLPHRFYKNSVKN